MTSAPVCKKCGKPLVMRSLAEHCQLLSEAIVGIGGENYYDSALSNVSSYLTLASGIRSVEFDTWQHLSHPEMCGAAGDYREFPRKLRRPIQNLASGIRR